MPKATVLTTASLAVRIPSGKFGAIIQNESASEVRYLFGENPSMDGDDDKGLLLGPAVDGVPTELAILFSTPVLNQIDIIAIADVEAEITYGILNMSLQS